MGIAYTWQQTEIIKLAYQGNYCHKTYKEVLDRNHYLRYNLLNLKSSSYLGAKLLDENTSYEIPKVSQVLSLVYPKSAAQSNKSVLGKVVQGTKGTSEKGFFLSSLNMQDVWPISLVTAYMNRQAQAQDIGNQ